MKLTQKIALGSVLVAGVSAAGAVATASAATEQTIGQSAFTTDSQTATSGGATATFLKEGIHLRVPNGDSAYAIGVFRVPGGGKLLSAIDTVTDEWFGTGFQAGDTARPGVKLDVDVDGDGKWDCQLVHEDAYGSSYLWLNKDTQDSPDSALPDDTCADAAPNDGGGASGQPDGTTDSWNTALDGASDAAVPNVVLAGYGASGSVQDGVLRSISLGDDQYSFTSASAPVTEAVTGRASHVVNGRYVRVDLSSDALSAGAVEGARVDWKVTITAGGGSEQTKLTDTMGASSTSGEDATYRFYAARGTKYVIKVYNGSTRVSSFTIQK